MPDISFAQLSNSRRNNLDFLRFFLACVVIHTHSYEMVGHHYTGMVSRIIHLEFGGAWLAVNGFFAISGFLIAASWLKSQSTPDYFRKRALRIYPGFIAAILFCVLLVGPLGGADIRTYFTNPQTYSFFRPLLFGPNGWLPGVFESQPWKGMVNSSLWTIRFELFCYVFLAALGLMTLLRRRGVMLSLLLLAVTAQFAEQHEWPMKWNLVTPFFGDLWEIIRFIVFFLAGTAFYLYREKIPFNARIATVAGVILTVAFAAGLSTLALPFCGVYLLFFFAFHPHIPLHNFGKHGDFSYGMYLYAFPVQQLLVLYVPFTRNPILLTLLAFVCTLVLAYLSWHFIEKPFLSLKRARRPNIHVSSAPSDLPTISPAAEPS
jgi:peptidoglycan/LPS O-acetylase OafA/YrhL